MIISVLNMRVDTIVPLSLSLSLLLLLLLLMYYNQITTMYVIIIVWYSPTNKYIWIQKYKQVILLSEKQVFIFEFKKKEKDIHVYTTHIIW